MLSKTSGPRSIKQSKTETEPAVRRSFKKRLVNFIDLIGAESGRDAELVGRSGSGQGHGRKSLEVYSKLAITDAQQGYNEVINNLITSTLRVVSASLVLPPIGA